MGPPAPLLDVVTRFLDEKGWPYVAMSDGSLMLTFDGQNGHFRCRVLVDEARAQVVYYSLFPATVPPERQRAVVELVNQANLELVIGNLEFDPASREVRCRTGIDVEGDRLTSALLTHVVHANVLAMDRYLPVLAAAIQDGAGPVPPPR